ncbi:FMN reductase [Candidatus Kaiserbacteria bacterium RIFCSPHIGHO2_02_FULL_59_21]|uniref:NADPH-dependent FMN reductase n=2 Tax=Candidatus Kaiseribacteriota TaxID=1752734 RepID=A0A0G1YV58_9BACT|nr:MAG: NADPH-dependent FMN reductase [Candidatus Kaiserbacteria bacterium GW2011_GWA2_58_9]OGG61350.1 MAG: FMN reductase [Candidatus Kaiserbacteria bacterium RIFCSPHIGHO2_01_FULL_58_22]OGG66824.1 MAG: FMN reductase [Candidatus Kaiserbacteria bacterium RIFCSPHIGHO2_02_FULL_59_21]OGG86342.1 MAG: FMN reductase [Candidatus Kaiserbacteria bacterium RIFCSPLOWO2_02_FULL_59_19]
MEQRLKVKIILGSTRQGRFSEKPGRWIHEEAKKRGEFDAELLDLRDYEMPFFDEPVSPSYKEKPYEHEAVVRWTAKIAEADAFIIIAPEYNHGYPGVLKNALDYAYQEWNNKPVAFVSYGSALGARSVEQLREVAVELQMAPIRNAIHMPYDVIVAAGKGVSEEELFAPYANGASGLLDQLAWWAKALKAARGA